MTTSHFTVTTPHYNITIKLTNLWQLPLLESRDCSLPQRYSISLFSSMAPPLASSRSAYSLCPHFLFDSILTCVVKYPISHAILVDTWMDVFFNILSLDHNYFQWVCHFKKFNSSIINYFQKYTSMVHSLAHIGRKLNEFILGPFLG